MSRIPFELSALPANASFWIQKPSASVADPRSFRSSSARTIVGILSPCDPDFPDLHFIEEVFGLNEPRDVVPMLMGKDKDIDLLISCLHHILDHFRHFRFRVRSGDSNTAVDQDLVVATIVLSKSHENAITETVTVDTNRSVGACGPCRLLLWGFAGSGFFRGVLFPGLCSAVRIGRPATQRLRHLYDLPWRRDEGTGTAHLFLPCPGGRKRMRRSAAQAATLSLSIFWALPQQLRRGSFGSGILACWF